YSAYMIPIPAESRLRIAAITVRFALLQWLANMNFFLQQAKGAENTEKNRFKRCVRALSDKPPVSSGMDAPEKPMDSSTIADRRRLRRKLGFWRLVAVVLLVAFGFALFRFVFGDFAGARRPQIAHVTISGLIRDNDELLERLK